MPDKLCWDLVGLATLGNHKLMPMKDCILIVTIVLVKAGAKSPPRHGESLQPHGTRGSKLFHPQLSPPPLPAARHRVLCARARLRGDLLWASILL